MKIRSHHDIIVPGFNELAKQLHSEARADYLLRNLSDEPRAGFSYLIMCQSRMKFKCIFGGEKDICDMWQVHYKKTYIINSVDSSK